MPLRFIRQHVSAALGIRQIVNCGRLGSSLGRFSSTTSPLYKEEATQKKNLPGAGPSLSSSKMKNMK
jgi:hypothetical protein